MNISKKMIIAVLAVVLTVTLSQAQRGQRNMDPEQRAERLTERMTDHLSLNDAQATEVKAIHLKYGEKIEALRKENTDREAMHAAMQKVRQDLDADIKKVLTDEQYQLWVDDRPDRPAFDGKDRPAGKGRNADPNERVDRQTSAMVNRLSLDDGQAAQVKVINQKYAAEMQEVFQTETDPEKRRAALDKIREAQEKELAAVLNAEQQKKWEEMKANRPHGGMGMGPGPRDFDPAEMAEKRTERMTDHLSLTDEQAAKVKAITLKYAEQRKALHENTTDPAQRQEAVRKLRDEEQAEIKAVLTPEQLEKWQEKPKDGQGARKGQGKSKGQGKAGRKG